ncbi:hypothetical protein ACSMXN_20860 [Jatrophihabitans sp. DSM 45814]
MAASDDGLLPSLGPIDVSRFVLDLAEARLRGDPELIALVDALSRLAALLIEMMLHGIQLQGLETSWLIDRIRAHQDTRADLAALDRGERP